MARVVIENLSKNFPGPKGEPITAVRGVSLAIEDKEFVVLVGPSGCGKSTTLRLIAGLEEIDAGTISIDGRVVNRVEPKDRDIAMVFQNYALYPHMTVFENMAFGLRLRKFPRAEIEARVKECAGTLGLTPLLTRLPKALSGGQRQRVAVGRAIVRQPKVFLFDEPLSNLDAQMRVQMRAEISRLHDRLGATMIYVTHDQVEAMTMGDRIVVMKDGVIQQVADPDTLYHAPANQFVAGFMGAPPMNFFRGRLSCQGYTLFFHERPGAADPAGGWRVADDATARLKVWVDREIVLGLRPEDLSLADTGEEVGRVQANVDLVEPLGAETCVYADTGVHRLVARVPPKAAVRVGQTVTFSPAMGRGHYFNPADGTAIR